jgi:hypothetical protein
MRKLRLSTNSYYTQTQRWVLKTWGAADRGWRATLIGGLVIGAVLVGLPVPW